MLVVDRAVFAQLQADHTGIDFMELSANLIRAQAGSTPSILDSEATSKGLSPTSLGFSPPAYEDIFGDDKNNSDLPPSYSEVSLMFRTGGGGNDILALTDRRRNSDDDRISGDVISEPVASRDCVVVEVDDDDIVRESRL